MIVNQAIKLMSALSFLAWDSEQEGFLLNRVGVLSGAWIWV